MAIGLPGHLLPGISQRDTVARVAVPLASNAGPPDFTAADLFPRGRPTSADLRQTSRPDCAFVSAMGVVADLDPQQIEGAIRTVENADGSTSFLVRLHDRQGLQDHEIWVPVSQQDIRELMAGTSAGLRDNGDAGAPLWPDVMEAAMCKRWVAVGGDKPREGVYRDSSEQALYFITGRASTNYAMNRKGGSIEKKIDREFKEVDAYLRSGRPMMLGTSKKPDDRDGLLEGHAYMVQGVAVNANGEKCLVLRNPWAFNGDANNVIDGRPANPDPVITVPIRAMIETDCWLTLNNAPLPQFPPIAGMQFELR